MLVIKLNEKQFSFRHKTTIASNGREFVGNVALYKIVSMKLLQHCGHQRLFGEMHRQV